MEKSDAISDFFSSAEASSEEAFASEVPEWEPPTLEKSLEWLASVRSSAMLAVLREPEFARISAVAFSGFRVNAQGYSNPLVRRRLAQETTQNEKFAERLQALAELQTTSADTNIERSVPSHNGTSPHREVEKKPNDARAEKQRDKRQRDEARAQLIAVQQERDTALRDLRRLEDENRELRRQQEQLTQRLTRQERNLNRRLQEQSALTSALRQAQSEDKNRKAPPVTSEIISAPTSPEASPWEIAVRHLLHKQRYDIARSLADDVLRDTPGEPSALDILATVAEAQKRSGEATGYLKQLVVIGTQRSDLGRATDALLRLLMLTRSLSETRDVLRPWLLSLEAADAEALNPLQAPLVRLRGLAPGKYQWLATQLQESSPALATKLMPAPGVIQVDDPLPLDYPEQTVTAKRLVSAVNAGESTLIVVVREKMARLDAETQQRIWQALEIAADGDPSVLIPIRTSSGRGPVILDGSNAAWFGQEYLAAGRPRLQPILALRRLLRQQGFFPVIVYGDAPLPYTIDAPESLRQMTAQHEIQLVDSGVDADEVLLREARLHHAPLVTNDHMNDWDRDNDVEKIRFDIAPNGTVSLLFQT